MRQPEAVRRGKTIAILLLVIFAPVVILSITLGFLLVAEGLVLSELSLLEILELYLLDLALFVGAAYLLYRLTLLSVERRLPEAADDPDRTDDRGIASDGEREARESPPNGRDR
ncbi:hypothetical protein ACFQPA_01985 [Halomarina halobia]|uniref:CbaC protein n=1 Tax=Halomarina halobia TaxID=3033386 RepID=A0ABD6A4Y7_9EURY|nr:hypothetical protein [Halomarina sp. PSR21]